MAEPKRIVNKEELQSHTIDFLRFPLIMCVVFVHAYSSTRLSIDNSLYPAYKYVSYFFSLEISQLAVPMFFFISGYLFFYHSGSTYLQKLKRRSRSLLIPYLFWNGLILLLYYVVESLPGMAHLFSGQNTPIHKMGTLELIRQFWDGGDWSGGNGTPILHQFWYMRNMMLMVLITPIVKLFVRYTSWVGVVALLALWMLTPGMALMTCSLAFFTAGACFSLHKLNFTTALGGRFFWLSMVVYPVLLVVNMALKEINYILWLDRVGFIAGTVFFINLVARLLERGTLQNTPFLAACSFFVFAMHDPMLTVIKRVMMKVAPITINAATPGPFDDAMLVVIYFLSAALSVFICMGLYSVLRRWVPGLIRIIAR